VKKLVIACLVSMLLLLLVPSALGCYHPQAMNHNVRGIALAREGQYEQAILEFNKAIEIDPDYGDAYFGRGLAYAEKGEVAKAVSDLEKCIKLSDDSDVVKVAQEILDELR